VSHAQIVVLLGAMAWYLCGMAVLATRAAFRKEGRGEWSVSDMLRSLEKHAETNVELDNLATMYPFFLPLVAAFVYIALLTIWPAHVVRWVVRALRRSPKD